MKFQIKQVSKKNYLEVNQIRKQAYDQAKGMTVKDEGIFWNKSDDQSIVLGIYDRNQIIATMRAEILTNLKLVEKKMECPWNYGKLSFPTMILSKAAVNPIYKNKGFISILRLLFFKKAKEWNVKTVLGTMTENSLRVNSMKNLGYTFHENLLGWKDQNYVSNEKVLISILDFDKFGKSAIKILSERYSKILEQAYLIDLNSIPYSEVKVVS